MEGLRESLHYGEHKKDRRKKKIC